MNAFEAAEIGIITNIRPNTPTVLPNIPVTTKPGIVGEINIVVP